MKTYKMYRPENESKGDKKAYAFLEKLIEGGYEDSEKRIIIDQNGDCHLCDLNLAKMDDIEKRSDIAVYAIAINFDKIKLQQLF